MNRPRQWAAMTICAAAAALMGCGQPQERARNNSSLAKTQHQTDGISQEAKTAEPQGYGRDPLRAYEGVQAASPMESAKSKSAAFGGGSYQAQRRSRAIVGHATPGLVAPVAAMPPSAPEPLAAADAARQNPNMYISNGYMGGTGARDRLDKLIQEGVLVDGKRVKLEAFSRSYAQTFPIPTATALHVTADTERARIIQEGDHTYLQVGLQAIKGELPRRPPLNIALVIDRSGSMQSEQKLDYAKAAAIKLVDSLRTDDTFSLTVFDDNVQLLVPAQRTRNKESIKSKIAALTPGGGTNIYAGLQSGYREAAKFAGTESVNRVILLSDGEVTAGVSDPQAFQRLTSAEADKEIQTTSVGLGLEFNEDLMMAIARDGKGNYHFIKDGADTRTVFAKELDELTHVVAKAVKLRIQLAQGIGLVRVLGATTLDAAQTRQVKSEEKKIDRRVAEELGIAANRQTDRDEPGIKLIIPDFYRGDNHIVMLEVAVPKGLGSRKVADVFLKYKDLVSRTNQSEQAGVTIQYTADRADMVASINRAVKKNLLGFQTGEALADAGNLITRGDVGGAVKRVDERMVVLGLAAKEWRDRDLDKDGLLLSRYEAVLKQLGNNPQLAGSDLGHYVAHSLTYAGYKMTR